MKNFITVEDVDDCKWCIPIKNIDSIYQDNGDVYTKILTKNGEICVLEDFDEIVSMIEKAQEGNTLIN